MAKADRRWIDPADIARTLAQPLRRERQADGRVRTGVYIPRLRKLYPDRDAGGWRNRA